ncbi:hypothetical protein AVEN_155353-1 [Araneus ventricosus]|uniref:Uncharacterized protein n=1 Tax=Araneus ventricosus TaxID=182803 RepID=A0A4Y2LZU4_ARAVE|nr:hypothetical protein AVEN_155353-1 [Araneus ventricosus]
MVTKQVKSTNYKVHIRRRLGSIKGRRHRARYSSYIDVTRYLLTEQERSSGWRFYNERNENRKPVPQGRLGKEEKFGKVQKFIALEQSFPTCGTRTLGVLEGPFGGTRNQSCQWRKQEKVRN